MKNSFNLLDEPCIPITSLGLKSLKEIFSNDQLEDIDADPILKIVLMKFFIAITQAVFTPENDEEYFSLKIPEFSKIVVDYLENNRDQFWLYGEKPFLQMNNATLTKRYSFSSLDPHIADGNSTILRSAQIQKTYSNAEKFHLLLKHTTAAFGGKKPDNTIIFEQGYTKNKTGMPGPIVGSNGYLHNFIMADTLLSTIYINILTKEDINKYLPFLQNGVGVPPWEQMPTTEDCPVAKSLKKSLMGWLVPLSRYMWLGEDYVHITEGIQYPSHKEGAVQTSIALSGVGTKNITAKWANSENRPWRSLTAMLSFLGSKDKNSYDCIALTSGIEKSKRLLHQFTVWSGGISTSSNAGEQYVSGQNDYVESEVKFSSNCMNTIFYENFKKEMLWIETLSKKMVYASIMRYYKSFAAKGDLYAAKGANLFWQIAEQKFQGLITALEEESQEKLYDIRKKICSYVNHCYDRYCPNVSSRQLTAWSANKPNLSKYLKELQPKKEDDNGQG